MKRDNISVYRIINAVLLTVSIIVMFIIAGEAERYIGEGVYYIFPKRAFENSLSRKEITSFEHSLELRDMHLSHETIGSALIKSDGMSAYSRLIYTDADYVYMNGLVFADGWFFVKAQEVQDVIVLSEALAWKLLGTVEASGLNVKINKTEYKIAGVISQKSFGEEDYFAWLPLKWDNPGAYAEGLYIQVSNYNKIDSYKAVYETLDNVTKSGRNYYVTDINEYVRNIAIRPVIGLSFLGLYIAVILILSLGVLVRGFPMESGRRKGNAVRFAAYSVVIIAILFFVSFDIWVPGFDGAGVGQIVETLTNTGRLPGHDYLSYNMLMLSKRNSYSNVAFAVCIISLVNLVFITRACSHYGLACIKANY